MKSFKILSTIVLLSICCIITTGNCSPIINTISLISDGSTMVDLTNDETVVISMKEVPLHVKGLVDAETGSYHLTTYHELDD